LILRRKGEALRVGIYAAQVHTVNYAFTSTVNTLILVAHRASFLIWEVLRIYTGKVYVTFLFTGG
jgi:hypothetical protein